MEKTNIKVEFRMLGENFNPELISDRLNLKPDEKWEKGEIIKNKDIRRKYSCWIISTGYEESLDVNNQLEQILGLIYDKKAILQEISKQFGLDYRFDVIINIEANEKPAIYLSKDVIGFANDINAEFDIDLFINS
ncbi:DUF4279 domain-containing protein [Phosphitispora fastidiosa]|uniref:DUF4279 domain-containing protein n=1 Tax=Phosphitispora fastidiosa TaxID=2837202 RepID=UPI001E484FF7|nr:DUF4279 domain-containing protein [Phosphitispora fastidiosa]MBU7008837.1 hypothetical protein [Phosphitispora fastidiosa]